MKGTPELKALFDQLKPALARYQPPFVVRRDEPGYYELWCEKDLVIEGRKRKEVFFAGLIIQKAYVGFYFMPVYAEPEVKAFFAPELLKLLKGKSCFYFKKLDDVLLKHLEDALQKGFDSTKITSLLTVKNFILLAIFVIVFLILSTYMACLTSLMISQAIKQDKFSNLASLSFELLFRMIALYIAIAGLVIAPFLIGLIPLIMLSIAFPLFFVLLFFYILAYAVFVIWIALRLYFSNPALVLDNLGPVTAVKQSFNITRGNLLTVFILTLISTGLSMLFYGLNQNPQSKLLESMLLSNNLFIIIFSVCIFVLLMVLVSVGAALLTTFQYYAYIDFKIDPGLKKNNKKQKEVRTKWQT